MEIYRKNGLHCLLAAGKVHNPRVRLAPFSLAAN